MKTVEEILRESGLTDEQIKALDAKVTTGLTQVLSTASQTLEQAELVKRATAEKFDHEISPALDAWANEKAAYSAREAAYQAALKSAAEGGFKVPDILAPATTTATTSRTPDGKFVAGGNTVPGSPEFQKKLTDELGNAFSFAADTQWKYRTLFGKEMPDSPTAIIREASAQHMSPAAYAEKKYGFAAKEKEISESARKAEIEAAVKSAVEQKDKEWAEKVGNNPMLRQGTTSQFSTIDKAVKEGARPDPLKLTPEQRRVSTRSVIHKEIAENDTVQ